MAQLYTESIFQLPAESAISRICNIGTETACEPRRVPDISSFLAQATPKRLTRLNLHDRVTVGAHFRPTALITRMTTPGDKPRSKLK